MGYKITNPQNIAIWLSGFYHGRQNTTMLDMQTLEADARKLQDYCLLNPQVPVMQATETLFKLSLQPR